MSVRVSKLKRTEDHRDRFLAELTLLWLGNLYRLDIAQYEKRNSILNELPFSLAPKRGTLPQQGLRDVGRMIR